MDQSKLFSTGRRNFIIGSGHLLIGFSLLQFCGNKNAGGGGESPDESADNKPINAYIRIDADGKVQVLTGKLELGQGIRTALSQMAAEELDVDMKRVSITTGDTGQTTDERYTSGSASIESSGKSIRNAAASARMQMLAMAAKTLQVPVSTLSVEDGTIKSTSPGKQITYWQLLKGRQLTGEVNEEAPLKDPGGFKIVGTAYPRHDIMAMATGASFYVHDMRLPGMVHARVMRPPVYNATLDSINSDRVLAMPGVLKIVRNGSFVAVIASEEFQAIRACEVLRMEARWKSGKLSPTQDVLYDEMKRTADKAETIENDAVQFSSAGVILEAEYKRPYQMHGSIGPSCAIAQWQNNALTVWSHTQGVYPLRSTLADMLKIQEEQIRVIGVPGAGCYGHNGADDVGGDVALLAMEMKGIPVRLQWMRQDEHKWEPYGSAMVLNIKAALGSDGTITAWRTNVWSDTHSTRPGGKAGHLIAARHLQNAFSFSAEGFSGGSYRNAVPLYQFPRQVMLHNCHTPLRTSALRGLGAYANIFALESFMDELAEKAKTDPVDFRLKHLEDDRAKAVIKKVAETAGWKTNNRKVGTGIGFAFAKYKNEAAYFAVIAEVHVNPETQTYKVAKLTGCIEAGQTINPDGIKNQTEGGMIQSASWTVMEEVKYNADGITSVDWETYPIMRFADVPDIEVVLIDRPELEPLGAGEAAQGPTAAAIANAIYNATGSRLRQLPLTADKINWKA